MRNIPFKNYLSRDSVLFIFYTILIVCYLNFHIIRIFLYDSKYVSLLIIFILLNLFMFTIKYKSKNIYLSKDLFLSTNLIFCSGLIFSLGENNYRLFENIYLFFLLPIIILILFYNFFKIKYSFKTFLICLIIVFFVDSIYMVVEIIDQFFGFDIHKFSLTKWYMKTSPGRFAVVGSGWDYAKGLPFLHYDQLPKILGLRGWPHYSAPLYVISFFACMFYLYSKKSKKYQVCSFIFTSFGLFMIFMLGVKTHYLTTILGLVILGLSLNKNIFRDLFINLFLFFLLVIFNPYFEKKISNHFTNLFEGGLRWNNGIWTAEPGRIEYIFDIERNYQFLLQIPLDKLMSGYGYIPNFLTQSSNFEIVLLNKVVVLGISFLLIFLYITLISLQSIFSILIKSRNNKLKAVCSFLIISLIVLFVDTLHFGHSFTEPLYGLYFIIISCSFHIKNLEKNY